MAINLDKKLLTISKYIQKGQFDRAVKEYQKLLQVFKDDLRILNSLGDTYIKMGNKKKAFEIFEKVADNYAKKGFYKNAIAMYQKMLRYDKDYVEANLKMGDLYILDGSLSEAEHQYNLYSQYYIEREQINKAIIAYEKIIKASPDNYKLKEKLADLYIHTQEYDKMFSLFHEIIQHKINSGDEEQLDEFFMRVSSIAKKNDFLDNDIYFNIFWDYITYLFEKKEAELAKDTSLDMANILFEKGLYEKAEKLYQHILHYINDDIASYVKLIEIFKIEDRTDDLVEAYKMLAEIFERQDVERAKILYNEILKIDPDNSFAMKKLGKVPKTKKEISVETTEFSASNPEDMDLDISNVKKNEKDEFASKLSMDLSEIKHENNEDEIDISSTADNLEVVTSEDEDDEDISIDIEIKDEVNDREKDEKIKSDIETNKSAYTLDTLLQAYSQKSKESKSVLSNINEDDVYVPDLDNVVSYFEQEVQKVIEDDPRTQYDLAIGYNEMGIYNLAIDAFRKLYLIDEYRFKSLLAISESFVGQGNYDAAIESLEEALTFDVNDTEKDAIYFSLAKIYYQQKMYPQAFDYINKIKDNEVFLQDEHYIDIVNKMNELNTISDDEMDDDIDVNIEIEPISNQSENEILNASSDNDNVVLEDNTIPLSESIDVIKDDDVVVDLSYENGIIDEQKEKENADNKFEDIAIESKENVINNFENIIGSNEEAEDELELTFSDLENGNLNEVNNEFSDNEIKIEKEEQEEPLAEVLKTHDDSNIVMENDSVSNEFEEEDEDDDVEIEIEFEDDEEVDEKKNILSNKENEKEEISNEEEKEGYLLKPESFEDDNNNESEGRVLNDLSVSSDNEESELYDFENENLNLEKSTETGDDETVKPQSFTEITPTKPLELEKLDREINSVRQDFLLIKDKLSQKEEIIEKNREIVSNITSEIKSLKDDLRELVGLKLDFDDLKENEVSLREGFDNLVNEFNSKLSDIETEIKSIKLSTGNIEEIDKLKNKLDDFESHEKDIVNELMTYKETIDTLSDDIKNNSIEIKNINEKISYFLSKLDEHDKSINNFKQNFASYDEKIDKIFELISNYEHKFDDYDTKLSEYKKENDEIIKKISEVDEILTFKDTILSNSKRTDEIYYSVDMLETKIEAFSEKARLLDSVIEKNSTFEKNLELIDKKLSDFSLLENKIGALENNYERLNKKIDLIESENIQNIANSDNNELIRMLSDKISNLEEELARIKVSDLSTTQNVQKESDNTNIDNNTVIQDVEDKNETVESIDDFDIAINPKNDDKKNKKRDNISFM